MLTLVLTVVYIQIWSSLGVLPTYRQILVKVGRQFGNAGCLNMQQCPVRIGNVKQMPHVERVPRSLWVENPFQQLFQGSVDGQLQD